MDATDHFRKCSQICTYNVSVELTEINNKVLTISDKQCVNIRN